MTKERNGAIQNFKDYCHVNTKLLPLKIHFFCIYGAFAGVMPFLPVIAKELGISATALGVGYSSMPVFMFIFSPIVGYLADFFRHINKFIAVLVFTRACSYAAILTLSPITNHAESLVNIKISHYDESKSSINFSMPLEKSCLEKYLDRDIQCALEFQQEISSSVNGTAITTYATKYGSISYKSDGNFTLEKESSGGYSVTFHFENDTLLEAKDKLKFYECSPSIQQCSASSEVVSVFSTHQYWLFFTFVILGGIGYITTSSLSSVACYEFLNAHGQPREAYGRQRLFGTLSWGIISSLSGILNDVLLQNEKSFLAGFYLMAVLMIVDVIDLITIRISKAHIRSNGSINACKIMKSKENLVFGFGVVFLGVSSSSIDIYEFWFLEGMGASRTLLGLAIAMQCLVGEVPFMLLSGWLVNKFGHYLCLAGIFAACALRLLLYSILQDPWFVLPIDILHGVTHGLLHVTLASYTTVKAPKGMEATFMGVYGGLYGGLGYGFGSIMSGYGVDVLGPRLTFFISSMMCVGCLLLFLVAVYLLRNSSEELEVTVEEAEEIEAKE